MRDPLAELVILAGALAGGALIILVGLLVFSWVAEWILA